MALRSKIQQFMNLKETIETETEKIFDPILAEVERQDKKDILFPPVKNIMSVELLVARPIKDGIPEVVYLVLKIQPPQETDELTLILASRRQLLPNTVCLDRYGQTPRSLLKNAKILTIEDVSKILGRPLAVPSSTGAKLKWPKKEELKRFPLNKGINPRVIAKLILTEARRIHNA